MFWGLREATRGSSTLSQLLTSSVTSTNQSEEPRWCVVLLWESRAVNWVRTWTEERWYTGTHLSKKKTHEGLKILTYLCLHVGEMCVQVYSERKREACFPSKCCWWQHWYFNGNTFSFSNYVSSGTLRHNNVVHFFFWWGDLLKAPNYINIHAPTELIIVFCILFLNIQ